MNEGSTDASVGIIVDRHVYIDWYGNSFRVEVFARGILESGHPPFKFKSAVAEMD